MLILYLSDNRDQKVKKNDQTVKIVWSIRKWLLKSFWGVFYEF